MDNSLVQVLRVDEHWGGRGENGERGYVSGAPPAAPTLLVFPPLPSFSFLVKYNSC